MSENKRTVERYMDGFNKSDHAQILDCLTDDVEWIIPGAFHTRGKAEYDEKIEGDDVSGNPTVIVTQMVEENGVVIAEGTATGARKDGSTLSAVFCDVFVMENAKIRQLTSYLMQMS